MKCVFKTGSLYLNVRCLKCRDSRSHTFWFCRQDHRILRERMWIQMWLQNELLAMVQNRTRASKKACVRGVLAFQHNIHPQVAPYVVPSCQSACTVVFFVFSLVVRTRSQVVVSPTSSTSRRVVSTTPRNPWWSNGSPMTSTTMTSPSARRSQMLAEDEPITLKKACHPVCRRQSVMKERGDPLFAQVSSAQKNLRDTPLRLNRLGLSWSDKESKYSLTVKRRFETRIPSRLRPTKKTKIE